MTTSPFPSNGRHGETIGSWKYSILAFGWILWLLFPWGAQSSRWRLRLSRQTVVTTMALRNHYCFCNNFMGLWGKSCFCNNFRDVKYQQKRKKAACTAIFYQQISNSTFILKWSNQLASTRKYWFKQTRVATIQSFKKLLSPVLTNLEKR